MNGKGRAGGALLALLLSGAFALVFCFFNTPLGPAIGSDNAMYLTMGTALARGWAPYTQIFDHKGPLLFVLQTIPQLFFGGYQTLTVFVMEWAALFGCLLLVKALCAQAGVRSAWAAQLGYLALYAPCVGGGNLSEEYVSPLTLLGLLLILRAFGGKEERKALFAPALALGALAMAAFLTRANNALPLAGASLGLSLWLVAGRKWKALGACAAGVATGCALALAPVALWLASRGALREAVYGAITHNMLYAKTGGESRVTALLSTPYGHLAMGIAALSVLGAAASLLRTRRAPVALAMAFGAAFAGLAAFLSHKYYQHYLTLGVPLAALGLIQLLALLEERRPSAAHVGAAGLALVCCGALLACGARANSLRLAEREGYEQFTADAQALYAQVPEEERGSFMAYRVEPKWYVAARALPCMRFYFLQEVLGQADPRVMDEIARDFETDPPRWLVIYYNRAFSPPYDERVREIFETRYAFVDARGDYQLLKLKKAD